MRVLKVLFVTLSLTTLISGVALAKERLVNVTVQVNLNAPSDTKNVRLWIPYPMSDEHQDITNVQINGNYAYNGIFRDAQNGNNALYLEWKEPLKDRKLTYSFDVKRKEIIARFLAKEFAFSKEELKRYLESTERIPTGGKVKELALKITKGKKTVNAKARAIYDWVVDNMQRDPNVKGCGLGEVEMLLSKKSGKCIDIHSVFVALARASGIPAREVMGIRVPKGKEGDMTKMQTCAAEFYQPGYGWVMIKPADVIKMIFEKKYSPEEIKKSRDYYFGSIDESYIVFGRERDIMLNPPQAGGILNYFMYPYAEVDDKPLNEDIYGYNIGYKITFKEL